MQIINSVDKTNSDNHVEPELPHIDIGIAMQLNINCRIIIIKSTPTCLTCSLGL